MTATADDEAPRTRDDPAFRDAVTFSFGDPTTQLYGLARIGLGGGSASGFALVYAGDRLVGVSTQTESLADVPARWDAVSAAGVRSVVDTPLSDWTVAYDGAEAAFELRFGAFSAPAVLGGDDPVARALGMEGYDQLCTVTGTVRIDGGRPRTVGCLGQRGHQWGSPDPDRIELARTISAWLGADRAVTLTAVRTAKSKHHDEEATACFVFDDGEPHAVVDARLSTTYDGDLRQRRAGLELWMSEEGGLARRAAGEAVCGTTLDLGELRLENAFFRWHMEGRQGAGRYDVLRRVHDGGTGGSGGGGGLLRRGR